MNGNCKIPHCSSKFRQSAFSIKGFKLWNTLLTEIKLIPDIKIFYNKGYLLARSKPELYSF